MNRPTRRYGESEEAYNIRYTKWERRSKAFKDTPARRAAREVGQKIRAITCIDAMGRMNFEYQESHFALRKICDDEMHQLGYESLTEHRNRVNNAISTQSYIHLSEAQQKAFFKYQKLPPKEVPK